MWSVSDLGYLQIKDAQLVSFLSLTFKIASSLFRA